jgi:translocation and assembly module TamB
MSGSGQISRAEAGVLSLGTMRSPVLLEISRTSGRGRLSLPRLSANVAGGRIAGNFDLAWGYGLDLDTRQRFDKVDLPRVLNEFGAGSDWAAGKLTGSLSLKGRNIRSPSDLNGSFEARPPQRAGVEAAGPLGPAAVHGGRLVQ